MEFTVKRHELIVAVIDPSKYLHRQLTIRYGTIYNYLSYAQQLAATTGIQN